MNKLRDLILKKPTLEIILQVCNEGINDDYYSTYITDYECDIQELTLYKNKRWVDKDALGNCIRDEIHIETKYKLLPVKEFNKLFNEKYNKYEFKKYIVIYA